MSYAPPEIVVAAIVPVKKGISPQTAKVNTYGRFKATDFYSHGKTSNKMSRAHRLTSLT